MGKKIYMDEVKVETGKKIYMKQERKFALLVALSVGVHVD